jgi:hypothetical protein
MIHWKERELPKTITNDEEIAMLIVTWCHIGNVQTFFHSVREVDGMVSKVKTTLEFQPPGTTQYLTPHAFLRNKLVQNALRVALFKDEGKAFEACEMAWKYIEQQGYLR